MISNKGIGQAIIKACQNYAPLNVYVEGLFDRPITYVRGLVLDRDEYSEDFYQNTPMIILDSVGRLDGSTAEFKEYLLGIHTLIVHADEYFNKPKIDDTIVYEGIDEIEDINNLIIKAINTSEELKCYEFADQDSYAEPIRFTGNHTEYRGYLKLLISEENDFCIGVK